MTLRAIMTNLATRLDTIPGLRVYDFPSSAIQAPAIVLSMPDTPYDITLGGRSDEWTFPVWLLISKADDRAAYDELVPYLEAEGDRSIRAKIEDERTLAGACDTCAITRASPQIVTVAGTEYLAIEFTLEVFGHGTGIPPIPPTPVLTWLPLPIVAGKSAPFSGDDIPVYAVIENRIICRGKTTIIAASLGASIVNPLPFLPWPYVGGSATAYFHWPLRPCGSYTSGTNLMAWTGLVVGDIFDFKFISYPKSI